MSSMSVTPLSSFLIALSESPSLLERYRDREQRAGLLAEHGLASHPALSGEPTVEELHAHVQAEHPAQAHVRAFAWIKIGKLPWIKKAPTEEPKPEPPPPPPPSPPPPPPQE
jgi:hypothetical protein